MLGARGAVPEVPYSVECGSDEEMATTSSRRGGGLVGGVEMRWRGRWQHNIKTEDESRRVRAGAMPVLGDGRMISPWPSTASPR